MPSTPDHLLTCLDLTRRIENQYSKKSLIQHCRCISYERFIDSNMLKNNTLKKNVRLFLIYSIFNIFKIISFKFILILLLTFFLAIHRKNKTAAFFKSNNVSANIFQMYFNSNVHYFFTPKRWIKNHPVLHCKVIIFIYLCKQLL